MNNLHMYIKSKRKQWKSATLYRDKEAMEKAMKLPPDKFMFNMGYWMGNVTYWIMSLSQVAPSVAKDLANDLHNVQINLGNAAYRLAKGEKTYKCVVCGKPSFYGAYCNKPEDRGMCFHCDHWHDVFNRLPKSGYGKGDSYKVLVKHGNGELHDFLSFKAEIQEGRREFMGFGGRLMKFKLQDGGIVQSNNCWSGGFFPVEMVDRFKHLIVEYA